VNEREKTRIGKFDWGARDRTRERIFRACHAWERRGRQKENYRL
jgi:hypothetical protein